MIARRGWSDRKSFHVLLPSASPESSPLAEYGRKDRPQKGTKRQKAQKNTVTERLALTVLCVSGDHCAVCGQFLVQRRHQRPAQFAPHHAVRNPFRDERASTRRHGAVEICVNLLDLRKKQSGEAETSLPPEDALDPPRMLNAESRSPSVHEPGAAADFVVMRITPLTASASPNRSTAASPLITSIFSI
jgi:hypothetical protein